MKRYTRKHNPRLVRLRRSYTFAEVAEVYGVRIRTVQSWRKQGLEVLDTSSKPHLVLGLHLRRFLKEKNNRRKHTLKPGEFFCPRCRTPRKSLQHRISIQITDKNLGRYRLAIIRGICEVCDCRLSRFSSDRKISEFGNVGLCITEHKATLVGSGDSFVNTDLRRGENGES